MSRSSRKKLTWFTKGLRPFLVVLIFVQRFTKETDLIYEGIATSLRALVPSFLDSKKETDLIYEGIATFLFTLVPCSLCAQRNWPDLRRDCDSAGSAIYTLPLTKRNWPDLRRDCDCADQFDIRMCRGGKKLTWFTKGLRHAIVVSIKRQYCKETDLIYEGIATFALLSFVVILF